MKIKPDFVAIIIGFIVLAALALTNLLVISVLMAFAFVIGFFLNKFGLRMIGIELVTFIAVITGYVYGSFIGASIALVLIVYHLVVSGYFGIYFAWVIPEYPIIAYIASTMAGQNIVFVGISLVIAVNLLNIIFTAIIYKQNLGKYLPYAITNVAFNAVLFVTLGQILIEIV